MPVEILPVYLEICRLGFYKLAFVRWDFAVCFRKLFAGLGFTQGMDSHTGHDRDAHHNFEGLKYNADYA